MEEDKLKPVPGTRAKGKKHDKDGNLIKSKRLTQFQWGELLGLLKNGQYKQKELAEKYGVSVQAIMMKRKKLGGVAIGEDSIQNSSLKKYTQDKETVAALKQITGFTVAEAGQLITEAKRRAFERNEVLGKMANHLFTKAIVEKRLSSVKDDIKVILDLQLLFEKELRFSGLCLGFKDNDFSSTEDIPSLTISKMTPEDIANAQKKMRDSDAEDAEEGSYTEIDDGYAEDEV